MPRFPARVLPLGWQVAHRLVKLPDGTEAVRWFLQEGDAEGNWRDRSGPNQQRAGAITQFILLQGGSLLQTANAVNATRQVRLSPGRHGPSGPRPTQPTPQPKPEKPGK